MKRLFLIDGNSLINRAYYALPPLTTKDGLYTNAIYGFLMMFYKAMDEYAPDYVSVAFDLKAPTFRHKEYKDYKGTRKGMPPELAMQIQPLKELLDTMGVHRAEIEGFEADDIIGTLSKIGEDENLEVFILTGDRDALQLASKTTKILFTKKGISDLEVYDEDKVKERYELTPKQFIDLKGLMGDSSDNIPGVAGIGEKTGIKLLKEYDSIENLILHIDELKGAVKTKMEAGYESAVMSKRLATIVRVIPVEFSLDELLYEKKSGEQLRSLFMKYGFTSLMSKLEYKEEETSTTDINISYEIEELLQQNPTEIGLIAAIEDGNILTKRIVRLYLLADSITYAVEEENIPKLKELLERENVFIYGNNLKREYTALKPYGITLPKISFDSQLAQYILNPSEVEQEPEKIGIKYGMPIVSPNLEDLLGKGKKKMSFSMANRVQMDEYFAKILAIISHCKTKMLDMIQEEDTKFLFEKIELPLMKVLGEMEYLGIAVNEDVLCELEQEFAKLIVQYEQEIYDLAGEEFNINSPKQLGVVLFEKLQLPVIKKTKTGYSTGAEILEKLYDKHPIISKILSYRQVSKLQSTYVIGLLSLINPTSKRIHSTFNQTLTTTGRISSLEPNLQNIPVRTEMGRELRKVFVAKEGYVLVDADYSQIELRVLAHMAQEKKMIEGFHGSMDIHTKTASEVFSVPVEEVTKELRSAAKAVNFGIVYGISDFGLSNNLNITKKQAKEYIDLYFARYPGIKTYMDTIVKEVEELGYSTTLCGRRRYIPEIKSSNFIVKNMGKRLAMNTPIQGSAADIIKIAMNRVFEWLKTEKIDAELVLQVHDELLLEVREDDAKYVRDKVIELMEGAWSMDVPLKVDATIGDSWYETK